MKIEVQYRAVVRGTGVGGPGRKDQAWFILESRTMVMYQRGIKSTARG